MDPAEVVRSNRRQALKYADAAGKKRLTKLLIDADADLRGRLKEAKLGAGSDSFTAVKLELMLRQVRDATKQLNRGVKDLLVDQATGIADRAAGDLIDYMGSAHKQFRGIAAQPLALDEARVLDSASEGARASVLRRLGTSGEPGAAAENVEGHEAREGILDRYGMRTVENFEESMRVGILTGQSVADMRDAITEQSPFLQGAPAYWAERIVRTETMGAYARASWEATREVDEQLGDAVKILSATFDDRTGWDSYQVHGQIRRPEEAFEWADGLYQHPPNRPNDREVVVPHRISWPIPPYLKWRSDEEVERVYRKQRKKGSPGPRPKMTTVAIKSFGKEE